jgi:regulatory protein
VRSPGAERALDPAERLQQALELAHAYLAPRDRTVREVTDHLEGKRVDATTIDETLATLTDQGYLDDARFVRLFAEDKRELEQWGADRIRRGLAARGVERELIEATLAAPASDGELERALELLERRFPSPPLDRRARDRALGVLLRKGYDPETSFDAVQAYSRAG